MVRFEVEDAPPAHIKPYVPRNEKGQPLKGHSLNPGGRPPSLSRPIRHFTADGLELVAFHLSVMRGEPFKTYYEDSYGELCTRVEVPDISDRLDAGKWLTDRGFGKEPIVIQQEHTHSAGVDLSRLTTDQLKTYLELARVMKAPTLEADSFTHVVESSPTGTEDIEDADTEPADLD